MLETWPPGLLDDWIAYHGQEPFGQAWLRGAITSREVASLSAMLQALMGSKDIRWPQLDDFLPGRPKPGEKPLTPQQLEARRVEREQAAFRTFKV